MKAVVDRIVQYANRYQLTNVETGEVLGTFDFEEVTGTVQQVGTEIDKELFDSIASDLAARVKLSGGELAGTIVTFSDISGTAANVASGDTSATLWGKVKNWFSRLKALAFKNKVASGDFEAGAIKNADVAADAAIAQGKVSGLMTDYVASIDVSGRTVTYKNKNGVNMGSITTQDTTYGLASPSSNGLMSATDKTKLDGIESGAQKNTVLGVKGGSESAYRTGNVNITKENIGLGNVDNTSDEDKPVSTATQKALNGKANTSGTYSNLTVGKATNADKATDATNATKATQDANGNVIDETYATKTELVEATGTKVKVNGTTQPEVNFTSDPQTQINDKQTQIDNIKNGTTQVGSAAQADKLSTARNLKVDLASDTAQSFDGSGNATEIGVKGILPVGNGGTGATSLDNITVWRAKADGSGNNIESTYAKLSQVVRTDTAQSLSVGQQRQALQNIGHPCADGYSTQKDWLHVARLSFEGQYVSGGGYNTVFLVGESNGYDALGLLQVSGGTRSEIGFNTMSLKYIDFSGGGTILFSADSIIGVMATSTVDIYIRQPSKNYIITGLQVLANFGAQKPSITLMSAAADSPSGGAMATEFVVNAGTIYSEGLKVFNGVTLPNGIASGTVGSLTLSGSGWYVLYANYQYTGLIYWFNSGSAVSYPSGNSGGGFIVNASGVITAAPGNTVTYYRFL